MPSIDLFENTPANKVNLSELCNGKTVILFAVPGAFTPGCSKVSSINNYCFKYFCMSSYMMIALCLDTFARLCEFCGRSEK